MTGKDLAFLKAVYALEVDPGEATRSGVERRTGTSGQDYEKSEEALAGRGLIMRKDGRLRLTPKGRAKIRVVFIGGGFEVIHSGHLHTVESAKKLGDFLVVAVATDSTIRRRKKREPLASGRERVKLLSSLRQVDLAILGSEGDIYETLERVKPDVVALGYDQYHAEKEIEAEGKKRGLSVSVVRLDSPVPSLKTSKLLESY